MKKIKLLIWEVKRHLLFKLIVALCIGVCFCMLAYKDSGRDATAYISLNYPGALNGQYLNGTRLNMYDVLSDSVLQNAIEKAGLEDVLSPRDLSNMLSISPRHSSNPLNEYIATEFEVDLHIDEQISGVDSQGLLQMVCMAFIETFYNAHAYNQTVLTFSLDELPEMDYEEIGVMLQTKVDLISDYLDYRYQNSPDFFSYDTNEGFSSLRQRISDFSRIIMENYNAYMLDNGVTKDLNKLRSTLDYEQILLTRSYDSNMAGYTARLDSIKAYDAIQSAIVMIPTVDTRGEFYMSKTKIGVDYLAQDANAALGTAMDIKKTIDRNDTRISLANAANETARLAASKRLDAMIQDILSSLTDLEQLVIKTDDDYIRQETARSLIYRMREPGDTERYGVKMTLVVVAAAFALLTALIWTLDKQIERGAQKDGHKDA